MNTIMNTTIYKATLTEIWYWKIVINYLFWILKALLFSLKISNINFVASIKLDFCKEKLTSETNKTAKQIKTNKNSL